MDLTAKVARGSEVESGSAAIKGTGLSREPFGQRLRRLLSDKETWVFVVAEAVFSVVLLFAVSNGTEGTFKDLVVGLVVIGLLWLLTARIQLLFLKSDVEHSIEELTTRFDKSDLLLSELVGFNVESLRDEQLASDLKKLVSRITFAATGSVPAFREYVKMKVNEALFEMSDLSEGILRVPFEISMKWAKERLGESQSMFATTLSGSISFWISPAGQDYLDANFRALARPKIRVFILESSSFDPRFKDVMKQHVDHNIEVWIVHAKEADPRYVKDIAVFDTAAFKYISIWEAEPGSDHIKRSTWSIGSKYVEFYKKLREHLEFRAHKITTKDHLEKWFQAEGMATVGGGLREDLSG